MLLEYDGSRAIAFGKSDGDFPNAVALVRMIWLSQLFITSLRPG